MRKLAAFAALATATWALYINVCQLIFQCGCTWLWAGAATQCNIHRPGVKHCPVCMLPSVEYHALLAMILAAQAYCLWRDQWAGAVLSFPLLASAQCLVLGWYVGYWS